MKRLTRLIISILSFTIMISFPLFGGTTGKIAGQVVDKTTGGPLPGVNILVIGTTLGGATDIEGQYTILEVPPGRYDLQVSSIGYKKITVKDVHVNIDQTTRVNVDMVSETIEVGEVVVTAEKPLIKPDVATSVVAISDDQIKALPITNVVSALGLQAGVRGGWGGLYGYAQKAPYLSQNTQGVYQRGNIEVGGGLSIRGGGGEGILFMMNGVTLRDPRNNEPDTRIPLSSIKEVSIERGGFNAEYGQVQSGIVNVVTREGSRQNYSGRFQIRMSPPAAKYWLAPGVVDVNNPMSYALRSFFDPEVCWTGTDNWDYYKRSKYPVFQGWDALSEQLNAQGIILTPAAAQRAFEYEIRKREINDQPDYDIDAGFGGPVPFVSDALGNLRFYASYRSSRTMLVWPLSRPDHRDYDGTIQFSSNISSTMKLQISALYGERFTERQNFDGLGGYFYPESAADVAGNASYIGSYVDLMGLYSDFGLSLTDIWHRSLSAKFTHTISPSTYYEVLIQNYAVHYNSRPGALRDTTQKVEVVPGFYEDSNPFGYWPYFEVNSAVLLTGSQFISRARDHSFVSTTSVKADIVSQVNFENLVKAGISFEYNDLNFDYGIINSQIPGSMTYAYRTRMNVFPFRGAAYIQDKLEAKEFTLNAGLRLDYSDANVHWWDIDPFNKDFFSSSYSPEDVFPTKKSEMQWFLSPRLGIAHPITENAKLFFNYGWFRELPQYETILRITRNQFSAMYGYGNPNLIMSKTISYELGVDFSIGNEFLLQAAGYYNDITDQQDVTQYIASSGFSYYETSANSYADRRGFELTLRRTGGDWVNGFINYTYQVNTTGHFGHANIYNDISSQADFNATTTNLYQDRPIPQPFARANLNFFTPKDFGPTISGYPVFGDLLLNVVLDWQAGYWTTWSKFTNISYNVQAVDYFNGYLRLQKTIDIGKFSLQLFMDVNNVFNIHRLWFNPADASYIPYVTSLHLPESNAYDNIPGDDKVGDYREPGVDWQPMEQQAEIDQNTPPPSADRMKDGNSIAIYYASKTKDYWWYRDGAWSKVPQDKIDQVLEDKAYINMPSQSTFWFLDPRQLFFGLTVSFNLSD
jgi:outer membrane receptor protein involved in Fe transport